MTPMLAGLQEKAHRDLVKLVPCPSRLRDPIELQSLLVCSIVQNPYLNMERLFDLMVLFRDKSHAGTS